MPLSIKHQQAIASIASIKIVQRIERACPWTSKADRIAQELPICMTWSMVAHMHSQVEQAAKPCTKQLSRLDVCAAHWISA